MPGVVIRLRAYKFDVVIDAHDEGVGLCVIAGCQRCVSRTLWEEAIRAAKGTFLLL